MFHTVLPTQVEENVQYNLGLHKWLKTNKPLNFRMSFRCDMSQKNHHNCLKVQQYYIHGDIHVNLAAICQDYFGYKGYFNKYVK